MEAEHAAETLATMRFGERFDDDDDATLPPESW